MLNLREFQLSLRKHLRQIWLVNSGVFLLFMLPIICQAGEPLVLAGYDKTRPVKALNQGKYICLNGQLTPSFWEYPLRGDDSVAWQSPLVSLRAPTQKVEFLIAVGLGGSKGKKGWHRLTLNGKQICDFNTPTQAKVSWQGDGGSAEFYTLFIDKNNDLFGIMRIHPKSSLVIQNSRQKFQVTGRKNWSRSWFMLNQVADIQGIDIQHRQQAQSIALKIESCILANQQQQTQKLTQSQLVLCRWAKNKDAALSFSDSPVSLRGLTAINFFAKDKKLPAAANLALDKAVQKGTWINEIWPPELRASAAFKKHQNYIKQLSCVLWQAESPVIKRYSLRRSRAEVEIKPLDQGRLTVSLREPAFSAAAKTPLSLRVPLSSQTWEAKVFTQAGKQLLAQYEVIEETRLLRFAAPLAASQNFIVVYRNYSNPK